MDETKKQSIIRMAPVPAMSRNGWPVGWNLWRSEFFKTAASKTAGI